MSHARAVARSPWMRQVRLPDNFRFGSRSHVTAKPTCAEEAKHSTRARLPLQNTAEYLHNSESFYSVGSQHWKCTAMLNDRFGARSCRCENSTVSGGRTLDLNGTKRNLTRGDGHDKRVVRSHARNLDLMTVSLELLAVAITIKYAVRQRRLLRSQGGRSVCGSTA